MAFPYRLRADPRDIARRAISRLAHDLGEPVSCARRKSSAAALHARAMTPSHLQVRSSIVVSGSISPRSFRPRPSRPCAEGPALKEAAASLATATSEEECLHLLPRADRRRYDQAKAADGAWIRLGRCDRLHGIAACPRASATALAMPARDASGERQATCESADPKPSSSGCANLEPCASGSTRIFPCVAFLATATLQNSRSPAVIRALPAAPFGAHARPQWAASEPQGDFL